MSRWLESIIEDWKDEKFEDEVVEVKVEEPEIKEEPIVIPDPWFFLEVPALDKLVAESIYKMEVIDYKHQKCKDCGGPARYSFPNEGETIRLCIKCAKSAIKYREEMDRLDKEEIELMLPQLPTFKWASDKTYPIMYQGEISYCFRPCIYPLRESGLEADAGLSWLLLRKNGLIREFPVGVTRRIKGWWGEMIPAEDREEHGDWVFDFIKQLTKKMKELGLIGDGLEGSKKYFEGQRRRRMNR